METDGKLRYIVRMKTTIDIPEELLRDVKKAASVRTNKEAVITALAEYLRVRRSADLVEILGTFDDFMTGEDLERERGEA